ncbi:hypothetical protein [Stenotrophomonas rhizophila]|uniref:hypothetical protein n=1 Tax=Stenotrophomonas rhizophila TaxID=216778 RepID=UPI0010BFA0D1|nr:hypothetical protein [Stenotrophomonas rhizophila]TKK09705.1 hypothetical protein SrhCFBP13529_06010 [Stenotrophomonas rhizophila]
MRTTDDKTERRAQLTAAMQAAGCTAPRDWVSSELSENIAQFARFRVLHDVHVLADDVEHVLSDALDDQPDLQDTLQTLRAAVDPAALHALLRAYAKALGNAFVMVLDEGGMCDDPRMPGWQLMETGPDGPTGRLVQGLHEDYLDFEDSYQPLTGAGT